MSLQKTPFSLQNNTNFDENKLNINQTEDFSSIYQGLYKNVQNKTKTKFTPLIDVSKHKQIINKKVKITTKYLQSDNKVIIQNPYLPQLLSSARDCFLQQKHKLKTANFQIQKFSINNKTVYVKHQKQNKSIFQPQQNHKQLKHRETHRTFGSILSDKHKKLHSLSRKNVAQNDQNQDLVKSKRSKSNLSKKMVKLNPETTSIQFQKNKLIETILQVQEKKNKQKRQFAKIQYSHKSVLNFPFLDEKMIGNSKIVDIESSALMQKKAKIKSVQKAYALKQQFKLKNLSGIKKINWKSEQFPLINVQKATINKLMLRYLRIQNIQSPTMGFYKFYIGEGNNSQLIRQILKNRGYWIEVDSLSKKPNLVWNQLPCQQFYKYQTKIQNFIMCPKSINASPNSKFNHIKTFLKYHQTDYLKACQKVLPQKVFNNLLTLIIQDFKKGIKINYFQDIQKCSKMYMNYITTVKFNNVETVKIESISKESKQYFKPIDFKLQNHVKMSKLIGNKKGLFHLFLNHCEQNNQNINDFIPGTIYVQLGNKFDEQVILFLVEDQLPEGPWLVKPGQDTNRGHGIKILQSKQDLMQQVKRRNSEYIQKNKHFQTQNKEYSIIIQKYIEPLLYEGRKFDIRMWVLWAKNQLWWYKQGYLRTSSKQFNLKSTSKYVHLTNDAVQIQNQDYGKYESANKLSFSQFQKYLNEQKQQAQSQQNSFKLIYQQMKELTKKLFMICKKELYEETLNFELFGLDFLVGKDFKVWLIQCNTNPSLQIHCSLQSRLLPSLIDNLLYIVVDPLFPCPQRRVGKQMMNSVWNQQFFKFQILFDGDQEQL